MTETLTASFANNLKMSLLTTSFFAEICHRLQTARPSRIKCLLYYLLPWLYNMELVDASVNNDDQQTGSGAREGWGSSEATEMVTNNLFYITVKVIDTSSPFNHFLKN